MMPNPDTVPDRLRFLICTHHLRTWAGSELVTLEMIEGLRDLGHAVSLYTPFTEHDFLSSTLSEEVPVHTDPDKVDLIEFDVVYSHHQTLSRILPGQNLNWLMGPTRPVFLYNHLSPFEPFEFPGPFVEQMLADLVLCNSPETADRLAMFNSNYAKAIVFPNPAPAIFSVVAPMTTAPVRLQRLLSVSNHLPEELETALDILEAQGVTVTRIGQATQSRRVVPDDLATHDAVVTIGKTVQYALCAHRPVFCYDKFGGPGWLLPERADAAAERNFSGRCTPGARRPEELVREITTGFAMAASSYPDPGNYEMDHHLDGLLKRVTVILGKKSSLTADVETFGKVVEHEAELYGLVDRHYSQTLTLHRRNRDLARHVRRQRGELQTLKNAAKTEKPR